MLQLSPTSSKSSPPTTALTPHQNSPEPFIEAPVATGSKSSTPSSHVPPTLQQRTPFQTHKGSLSVADESLQVPPTHSRGLYSLAKDKINVLTHIAVRSKGSASSLRSRPQGSPQQQPLETYSSASSVDDITIHPEPATEKAATTLERSAIKQGPSASRPSVDRRRLLDRSPSPAHHTPLADSFRSDPNKMHQTSSRLLRMTEDERPYTRDFKDLFSTLMVSLPLTPHRVRFQKIDHTFTSEEAINNLGSLKFSQSNRMPDPKDPSRIVTTTTTTTFSMAKEMARSVCQRFMDARFIESADGKPPVAFPLKNAVWQMTPKGMHVLQRFCQRNGISQRHVLDVLDSARNTMHLVILERDFSSDKIDQDQATVDVIFRRFAGQDGPNLKNSPAISDADSVSDYSNGMVGVKMAKERKIADRVFHNTFTGKAAVDWLMDCCTTVDRRETKEICELFIKYDLMYAVSEDKAYMAQNQAARKFQPTRLAVYGVAERGQKVAGWIVGREGSPDYESKESSASGSSKPNGVKVEMKGRDSNNNRLLLIVKDPALRLLFREYLRDTHCEENLAFYMEVSEFTQHYDISERAKMFTRMDAIRESLAAAYGLYNAFLAPGSPCELNIDHNLRNNLAGRMTRAVGDDEAMLKSLQEVVHLFREAQTSVFKLMSSDSVPKFLKEPKYQNVLRENKFEQRAEITLHHGTTSTLPERTLSRVQREPRP